MKRLLLVILVLLLAGCGDPELESGRIRDRKFTPAHWESGYRTARECGYRYSPMNGDFRNECWTESVYEARHQWVTDRFQFQLERCEGDYNDKCRRSWRTITETEYHAYSVGDFYPKAGRT